MSDKVETNEAQAQEQAQASANDLSLNDLASMRNIIDLASTRGAFKANEMEAVGKVYNKLNTFLEAVAKQAEAAKTGA